MRLEDAFGQVLKKYRKEINLSQETLALKCGLDRTYISALERGKRQPTLKSLFQISETLRIPSSQLVSDVEILLKKKKY